MKKIILLIMVMVAIPYCSEAGVKKLYAGADQTIVAGSVVHLKGKAFCVSQYKWKSNGTGTFSNPLALKTKYIPSAADIEKGLVVLTLRSKNGKVSDSMNLYITSCGTVSSGEDVTVCGYLSGGEVSLQAQTFNYTESILWTTNGNGSFDNPQGLNPTYFYDASDVNSANIEIYATVSSVICGSYTDTLQIYFQSSPLLEFPEPVVNQNGSEPIFANVNLYGYASSGTWSTSGSGTFEDATATYTAYYPSAQDAINGCVELTFVSNDPEGPCGPTSGSMMACFNPTCPEVSVGLDMVECGLSGGGSINVEATVSASAEGILWETNGAGTFEDPNAFSTVYNYDPSDVSSHDAIEIYATISNFGCYDTDTLQVFLQEAPRLVFPVTHVYDCAGAYVFAVVELYGWATSGTWSTSGTGTFENPNLTYSLYTPGANELGIVTLTFTTNDPEGPCGSISGYMTAGYGECPTEPGATVQSVTAYPNPTREKLQLQTNTEINKEQTHITDLTGNRIPFGWMDNDLDVSMLKPGTYLLHAVSEQGKVYTSRFIKQ